MDLNLYVDSVRSGVTDAASLADDHTREVAHRLGGAIESSTRLALIRALSDAAGDISADLAPISVELRMSGADPEFVVQIPKPESEPTLLLPTPPSPPEPPEAPEADVDDEPTARISLRLPSSVKAKVDEMADKDGISTNAWLLRAIMDALGEGRSRTSSSSSTTDSLRGILGAIGPFGPDGPFGPNGVFGPHGVFRDDRESHDRPGETKRRGNVQGWVR